MRRAFFLGLAATILATAACSSGGSGSGGSSAYGASPQLFCGSYCNRVHGCDNSQDLQTCTDSCQNQTASFLPKYRSDLVGGIESCMAQSDCATVLSGNAVSSCVNEAVASVAPSPAGTQFCNDWNSADQNCQASIDMAGCLNTVKVYADPALGDADACTRKSCADMTPCIEAALGVTVTTSGT